MQRRYSHSHQMSIEKRLDVLFKSKTFKDGQEKTSQDSYVEKFLKFKSNPQALGKYLKTGGGVRIGRILEDIDALAGMISISHAFQPALKERLQVVTASLDRINMRKEFPDGKDIKLAGTVTYVGSSSMEVLISIESVADTESSLADVEGRHPKKPEALDLIAEAKFVMVALDKSTGRPIQVPRLILQTIKEHDLYEKGAEHRARKQVANELSLLKKPPNAEEMAAIHKMYVESRNIKETASIKPNVLSTAETEQKNLILTHPQDKNFYNKIFGGYLMRISFELAYATAVLATKTTGLRLEAVDDITFRKPVNVGSLLSFQSRVDYCPGYPTNALQVSVTANVVDPLTGVVDTTNDFSFTFSAADPAASPLPRVLPQTYEESLAYIDGMRRAKRASKE